MAAKISENVSTKPTWATYLKSPEFHLVRLPLKDKIQNGRHCKAMYYNFAFK